MVRSMNTTATLERSRAQTLEVPAHQPIPGTARKIVLRTSGRRHGSISRLASPSDVGELIKPFVFLDHAEARYTGRPLFGIHPHSGIATLTTVLQGGMAYEDTTGKNGQVTEGGLEWMRAGNGVWHDGGPLEGTPLRVFQLWVALPAAEENSSPESQYIPAEAVEHEGPVRVVLGQYGSARSPIRAPQGINYFTSVSRTGSAGAMSRRPATTWRGSR
jgi:redox-sensitive bicupin YhaK (pirin superfamily)